MKHKLLLLMAVLTFFANSCSTTDTPPDTQISDPSPVIPDAAAAMETIVTFSEFAVTPVTAFAVGAFAAIMAADASGYFGRQTNATYSFGKNDNIIMPKIKELRDNPFEYIGSMHNIGLNYLNKYVNLADLRNRFVNYDESAWFEVLNITAPGMTITEKKEVLTFAKQIDIIRKVQSKSIYTSTISKHDVIKQLSLSSTGRAYIDAVLNTFYDMRTSGKNMLQIADYINGEITARLNPDNVYSTEDTGILTFLTVLKHSGYYWYN